MFSAGPAPAMAAPTTPASTGVYKGIGSSPQQSDGTGSGGSIGSKSGMGFWFNIAGGSSSSSSMMGGRRGGGLWGRGAGGGGGVDEDQPPQKSPFQRLCALLGLATRVAGAATMAVNLLLFLHAAAASPQQQQLSASPSTDAAGSSSGSAISDQEQPEFLPSPFSAEALIRLYSVAFGLFLLLSEAEWGPAALRQHLAFLESWILRGLFALFVGALLHFPPSSSPSSSPSLFGPDGESSGSTAAGAGAMDGGKGGYLGGFQWVVGQGLVVLGCAYCALGVLCLRALKQRQLSRARRRKKQAMAQEQHAMHLQQHEIERLLADTESKLQHL